MPSTIVRRSYTGSPRAMFRCFVGILAFGAAVVAWSPVPLLGQSQLESEVRQALAEYVRAINEGRADDLAQMYIAGSTTGSVGGGQIYRGWSTVAELLHSVLAEPGTVHLEIANVTVTTFGPEAAVAYFDTEWRFGPPASTQSLGAMSVVFVRGDGSWGVAHDHTSSRANQALSVGPAPGSWLGDVREAGPPAPVREPDACEVTRIVDGDTIDCAPFGRIRLIGMDTPEAAQQPFGDMATELLRQRIPTGTVVEIEGDVEPTDRYGRVLGYIWSDGELINWWMVRTGYAVVLTYPPNVQYVDWFREAQLQARNEGVGLWAIDGFACEPRAHRRGECEGPDW